MKFQIYEKGRDEPASTQVFDTQVAAWERIEAIVRAYPAVKGVFEVKEVKNERTS